MAQPTTPSAQRVQTSGSQVPSPHYTTSRRHSLYGTEDRIVLDPGSRLWKVGFSGESKPREVFRVTSDPQTGEPLWSFRSGKSVAEIEAATIVLEHRLQDYLRSVFFDTVLVDPKSRKVLIVEHPLLPLAVKDAIARILFQNLQIPSISFAPSPVVSLLAAGRLTGLVLDAGHLETVVLPIYASRPLYTSLQTTPLAGARLNAHIRALLILFGTYYPPRGLVGVGSAPQPMNIPEEALTDAIIEEIKTRCCFVSDPIELVVQTPRPTSPSTTSSVTNEDVSGFSLDSRSESGRSMDIDAMTVASQPDAASTTVSTSTATTHAQGQVTQMKDVYLRSSTATDLLIKVAVPGQSATGSNTKASLLIPGWIRERAAELLFEEGDVDERSLAEAILEALLKVPLDLRIEMASSILVTGGTSMLPGFITRLHAEIMRLLAPVDGPSSAQESLPTDNDKPSSKGEYASPHYATILREPPARQSHEQSRWPRYDPYAPLRPLAPHIAILNHPDPPAGQSSGANKNAGRAPAFTPAMLPWVGGSLAGALKTGGEEISREQWDEAYEDAVEDMHAASVLLPNSSPVKAGSGVPPSTPAPPGTERNSGRISFFLPDWSTPILGSGAPSVRAGA